MNPTNPSSPLVWEYGQHWLPQVESAFETGRVTIGRENNVLVIRADLHDACVIRDEYPFNFPAFTKCDAFEIFLGATDEAAYYELHVTPANDIMQLFFDGSKGKKPLEELMVAEPLFTSQTALTADGWSVIARIPLAALSPCEPTEWLLSFGRYDHTRGQPKPVISSTSPHTVCNFHRKHEWRRMIFTDLPSI